MNKHTLTAFAAASLAVSGVGQTPTWTQVMTVNAPSARWGPKLVYDAARSKTICFGGDIGPTWAHDTWEYDGADWTQVMTSSRPSARGNHAMVFDSLHDRVLLFGGYGGSPAQQGLMGDLWSYDGTDWQLIYATGSTYGPNPRSGHAMVYDTTRDRVVLFGGYHGNSTLDQTWEYDCANGQWHLITTSNRPGPRCYHAMAYDTMRQCVVLFGGGVPGNHWLGDTWEYDGSDWTLISTITAPMPRKFHAMEYVTGHGVIMIGGETNVPPYLGSLTWAYDGIDWSPISTGAPAMRNKHGLTYDSGWNQVIVFGGRVAGQRQNDTWNFGIPTPPQPASAASYGAGCGVPNLDFSPTSSPILGTTAGALISHAPTVFAGVTLGYSDTTFNGLPILPYNLASLGMPGCYLLQSNEIFGLPVAPVTASTLQFDAAIPFDPALLTQQFYIQAYAFAPGANASQVVTSNGIAWTIGNQ